MTVIRVEDLREFDLELKFNAQVPRFYIWLVVCVIICLAGLAGMEHNSDPYKWNGLFMALVGFNSTIMIKIWYFIKETKLSVLQEMKQMQIQIVKQATKEN